MVMAIPHPCHDENSRGPRPEMTVGKDIGDVGELRKLLEIERDEQTQR